MERQPDTGSRHGGRRCGGTHARGRPLLPPPLPEDLAAGQADAAAVAGSRLPVHPGAEPHRPVLAGHQPLVREGTTAQIAGQRGEDPEAVGVARPDMPIPSRAAQPVQPMLQLLTALVRRPREPPLHQPLTARRQQLPPKHRHHHPHRQQKPYHTGRQCPPSVSPPPVTKQCRCGCNISVWLQVCSAAMIPAWAPRYFPSRSNSPSVSRTVANKRGVMAVAFAHQRPRRSSGSVKITWSWSPASSRARCCTSQRSTWSQARIGDTSDGDRSYTRSVRDAPPDRPGCVPPSARYGRP
jgi:hypothetical protein